MCCHFKGGTTSSPKNQFLEKRCPTKITVESPRCFWELKKVSQFVFLFHLSWSPPSNPRKCWLRLSDFGCYSCHVSPTPMLGCLGIFAIFVPTRDLYVIFFYVNLSGGVVFGTSWRKSSFQGPGFMKFAWWNNRNTRVFTSQQTGLGLFRLICPILLKLDWQWLTLTSQYVIAAAPPIKIITMFQRQHKKTLSYSGA